MLRLVPAAVFFIVLFYIINPLLRPLLYAADRRATGMDGSGI
jgi:hypothetical protein